MLGQQAPGAKEHTSPVEGRGRALEKTGNRGQVTQELQLLFAVIG